jgi:DNA-binding transcriptional ArsR family regulator
MTGSRIAELGALLGDPTRAGLLSLMMDGRASTVGELARASHVALSTASEHLTRLHAAGLVQSERQGRYRYYRIAGPQVAGLLETMDALPLPGGEDGPGRSPRPGEGLASRTPQELRFARSCYDHLAGTLAVALHDILVCDDGDQPALAPGAAQALRGLGVDAAWPGPRSSRRPQLLNCLDWSERRPHLAGATGAALLSEMLGRGWVTHRQTPRALRLTRTGREALTTALGPDPTWAPQPGTASLRS